MIGYRWLLTHLIVTTRQVNFKVAVIC